MIKPIVPGWQTATRLRYCINGFINFIFQGEQQREIVCNTGYELRKAENRMVIYSGPESDSSKKLLLFSKTRGKFRYLKLGQAGERNAFRHGDNMEKHAVKQNGSSML